MSAHYLAVPDDARHLLEGREPVYGEVLDDGRTVAKIRPPLGRLPPGVDHIGNDASAVRESVYRPGADQRFKVKATSKGF